MRTIIRWVPLGLLLVAFFCFFYFHLFDYLSFTALQQHRELLLQWTLQHYWLSVFIYMAVYIVAVAISVPGAIILTLTGGFLFGIFWGALYVVCSATVGASLIFLAVRTALGQVLAKKATHWVGKMERGFQRDAFSYLIFLRLVPIFPFWAINIVAGLLNVRLKTFFVATFFGIIPGSLVYVSVGSGLSTIFAAGQTPNLGIIFKPALLVPMLCLALLALVPVLYKYWQEKKHHA